MDSPYTMIEILIDNSGSMGYMKEAGPEEENKYLVDGETRMSLIKKLLIEEIIPTIDYANHITLRTFRSKRIKVGEKEYDTPSIQVIYQSKFEKVKLINTINALPDPPGGGTPIASAIESSVTYLKKFPRQDRKIILLTDGEENGGGNYIEAAKKANGLPGVACKIFIVGIVHDENSEKQSRQIATGGYCNITSKNFQKEQVKNVIAPLKSAILKNSVDNLQKINQVGAPIPVPQHVEEKIKVLKEAGTNETKSQLDELEIKLKHHLLTTQNLLEEFSKLRDSIKVSNLLNMGIDSTTLTIDNDYSESLRVKSESFLFDLLISKYGKENVKWLNENQESFSHHDFEIYDKTGNCSLFIECKGTPANKLTFYLTSDEWNHFLQYKEKYQIYRIFNLDNTPNSFLIEKLHEALLQGSVVPYLLKPEILKENRVFLTLMSKD